MQVTEEKVRKIIHIDMDAFYASVEQRDDPSLVGRPVAVGGNKERGVVAAASYEARKYGIHSAMSSVLAYKKCKQIVFVKPRFEVYKEVSNQVRKILEEYTDLIEPLSLDEAYLDVTENKKNMPYAMDIAEEIRARIKKEVRLNASAGVSFNKFLAKIASDYNKPNGAYVITPRMAEGFIEKLKIEKFFGVGKVTAKKMHHKGIYTGLDLKKKSKGELIRWFGKPGSYYYNVARGIDDRPVNPNRIRKSLGVERTYDEDITTITVLKEKLLLVVDMLKERLKRSNCSGKTLTLKVKYSDFRQITRSYTSSNDMTIEQIVTHALVLSETIPEIDKGIRLLGLQVSNFGQPTSEDRFLGQLSFDF